MRIGKIANSAESRMDEQFQIFGAIFDQFLEPNVSFPNLIIPNLKNSKNLQFTKFQKFPICEILKIPNLRNSKNFQFAKL